MSILKKNSPVKVLRILKNILTILPTNRAKGIVIYVKGANLSTKKFASAQKIIL